MVYTKILKQISELANKLNLEINHVEKLKEIINEKQPNDLKDLLTFKPLYCEETDNELIIKINLIRKVIYDKNTKILLNANKTKTKSLKLTEFLTLLTVLNDKNLIEIPKIEDESLTNKNNFDIELINEYLNSAKELLDLAKYAKKKKYYNKVVSLSRLSAEQSLKTILIRYNLTNSDAFLKNHKITDDLSKIVNENVRNENVKYKLIEQISKYKSIQHFNSKIRYPQFYNKFRFDKEDADVYLKISESIYNKMKELHKKEW